MEKFDFEPSFVRVASFSRPTATFCRPSTEWSPFSMIRNPFPRTHLRVSKRNACILSLSLSVGSRACMPVRTGNFGVAYTHGRGKIFFEEPPAAGSSSSSPPSSSSSRSIRGISFLLRGPLVAPRLPITLPMIGRDVPLPGQKNSLCRSTLEIYNNYLKRTKGTLSP